MLQVTSFVTCLCSLGCIGLNNPLDISANQHSTSKKISAPLLERVIDQDHWSVRFSESQQQIKAAVHTEKCSRLKQSAKNIQNNFQLLSSAAWNSLEKGASTWLMALPIDSHGFALHKTAFQDALSLRYGWKMKNSPSHCSCGHAFSIAHALSCPTGGYPSIRDITASLLIEMCNPSPEN